MRFLKSLVSLIFPNLCIVCGRELCHGEHRICVECRWDLPMTGYALQEQNYVTELFAARLEFDHACALLFFESGDLRRLIHRLKYRSRADIARLMGEIFGYYLRQSPYYRDIDLLVPVPLHWFKRLIRGYNQAEEICLGMSRAMGIECDFSLVKRKRFTEQQARKETEERWDNVRGAFRYRGGDLSGRKLLLIDDVLTTGSTIEACGTELLKSGCRLNIATLAVAVRHRDGNTNSTLKS